MNKYLQNKYYILKPLNGMRSWSKKIKGKYIKNELLKIKTV